MKRPTKVQAKAFRGAARMFLDQMAERANFHAERLDPNRKRDYVNDPLLKALDGIASQARRALDALDAKKGAE